MLEYFGFDPELAVVYASALAAALSFFAFVYPFLQRNDKRRHYKKVIEKRRKALVHQAREAFNNRTQDQQSSRESIASLFKVQELFGNIGEKIRSRMLQAGIRHPNAPIYYIITRTALPVVLAGFSAMVMTYGQYEFASTTIISTALGLGVFGYALPKLLIMNYTQKRQIEINLIFPDALDIMLICIHGGMSLEQTINRTAEEIGEHSGALAEELGILAAEMGMLNDRRAALQDFARRVGSGFAKSFATAIIQAEQYGTSISSAMRVIADELRDQRMAEAERKAAALPPKLTVPMILCFLPALFVIILGPAVLEFTTKPI